MGKKHYDRAQRGPQGPQGAKAFRVSYRREGPWLNAYLAPLDTMKGAILVGSIRFAIVQASDTAHQAFMALMQTATIQFAKIELGVDLELGEQEPAPEHERTHDA